MKKLLLIALMTVGLPLLRRHVPTLKCSSALASDRATTGDITRMGTTIRTVLITGRTMAIPTTAPTMDTAATVTTDIIVTITIITGKVMLT